MYKPGDRLTVVSKRPENTKRIVWADPMDAYLGKTLTVKDIEVCSDGKIFIRFKEAYSKEDGWGWLFDPDWVFPEATLTNISKDSILSLLE